MYSQIAAVAKHYSIRVLAIPVIANSTFGVLFLALPSRLTVNGSRTARSWPVCLGRFGVRFRYAFHMSASIFPPELVLAGTYAFPEHATPSQFA